MTPHYVPGPRFVWVTQLPVDYLDTTLTVNTWETVDADLAATTVDFYTLTITVNPEGSGNVTASPAQTEWGYADGTVVTLTAVPGGEYEFKNWSGTDDNDENPTTVTMDSNKSVTANFKTEGEDGGLSGGAIAGIIIGILAGLALIGLLLWYFVLRKKKGLPLR